MVNGEQFTGVFIQTTSRELITLHSKGGYDKYVAVIIDRRRVNQKTSVERRTKP